MKDQHIIGKRRFEFNAGHFWLRCEPRLAKMDPAPGSLRTSLRLGLLYRSDAVNRDPFYPSIWPNPIGFSRIPQKMRFSCRQKNFLAKSTFNPLHFVYRVGIK
jgi:hypothetical protein